jgi:acyl carrier protein
MQQDGFDEIVRALHPFRRQDEPITANTEIARDLDLDSLAVMNLLLEIEDKFDISIPLNVIPEIRTVGDLAGIVEHLREET